MKIKGYSLIEILVVLSVFGILAVVSTQAVLLSIRSSRKSESSITVKDNLDIALSTIERQLRFAQSVDCVSSTQVNYIDTRGTSTSFSCPANLGYIASGSARLTSSDVDVTCSFACSVEVTGATPSVTVSLTGSEENTTGVEGATSTSTTTIFLRQ